MADLVRGVQVDPLPVEVHPHHPQVLAAEAAAVVVRGDCDIKT